MAMEEDCRSTQLIDGNGVFNATGLSSFVESVKLSKCGVSYAVVAIMGPQSSGKSTLLNHLFRTDFVVMDEEEGRSQTTKGIWIAKADDVEPLTIVLDIEGNDGQERGEDQTFEKHCAAFALAVADVVMINIWCTDLGREFAAGMPLLTTVFEVMVKILSTPRKTTLLFVIRDQTKTALQKLEQKLIEKTEKIWMGVPKPEARKNSALSDFFTVKVTALPHYDHKKEEFITEVAKLKERFHNSIAPDGLAGDREAAVEGSGFLYGAQKMWKAIRKNKDLNLPTLKMVVTSFRCDEVIREITRRFCEDKRWLEIETPEDPLIPNFGKQLSSILDSFLSEYDEETEYFEEGVRDAKRKTLQSDLLQVVLSAYKTLLNHLRSDATTSFKTQLEEELRSGNKGFATTVRECVDSCMAYFDKRCADAKIQQADWNKYSSDAKDKLQCKIDGHSSNVRNRKLSEIVTRLENKLSHGDLEGGTISFLEQGNKDSWSSIRKLLRNEIKSVSSEFDDSISGFELEESRREELLQGLKNYATRIVEKVARDTTAKPKRVLFHMNKRFSSVLKLGRDSKPRRWNGDEDLDEIVSDATRECVGMLSVMAAIRLDEQLDDIESRLISLFLPIKECYPPDSNPYARLIDDGNENSSWDKVSTDCATITVSGCVSIWNQFLSAIQETVNHAKETLVWTANSRCEEIAGEILDRFRADKSWLELETAVAKSSPALIGFGKQLSSLLVTFLSMYDKKTKNFNYESVRDAKRKKLESTLSQLMRRAYEDLLKHLLSNATKMFETQLDEALSKKQLGLADSVRECQNSCMCEFAKWCEGAAIQEADFSNAEEILLHNISKHSISVRDNKLFGIVARSEKILSEGCLEDSTVSFLEQGNKDSWPSIRKLLRNEIESVSSYFNHSISGFEVEESRSEELLQGLKNYATRIVEKAARDTAKPKRVLLHMNERFSNLIDNDKDSKPRRWKGKENIPEIVSYANRQCVELLSVMAAIRLDEHPDDIHPDDIESTLLFSFSPTLKFVYDQNVEVGSHIRQFFSDLETPDCWDKVSGYYTILTPTRCTEIWVQFLNDSKRKITQVMDHMEKSNKKAAEKLRARLISVLATIASFSFTLLSIFGPAMAL